jgi:type I restriction enzyme S subunit
MSKLNRLIQELCPNGVEYRKLGEIGVFFGGLSGKSKEDFVNGNSKFITYKNIYSNPSLNIEIEDKVKIFENEKQHIVKYGDILFTGSSETPDECGMSSVVTTPTEEKLYLNSFCFGLRLNNIEDFNLHYLKHLLRSKEVRNQIRQTASGVTRYNVSKKRFANVSLPLPPLPIQEEIVKILDRFAEYTAELQAELQARKEQYEYYRNLLLTNNFAYGSADDKQKITGNAREEWKWMTLGEVCEICPGKDYKHLSNGEIPVYGSGGVMTFVDSFVYEEPTVLLPRKGSISNVFYVDKPFWNVDTIYYTKIDKSKILPKYFYYLVVNEHIEKYNTSNAARPALTRDVLRKIKLLIPSLELQQRIVSILDKFEALVSDLTQGLPAEIAASQERYEYYRDKLLRFERCN